jgi:glucan phosphoethanolaminetransferase (alkaline phosphatase superfamily)
MIQRIQSVFLLLVGIAMALSTFATAWSKSALGQSIELNALSLTHSQGGKVLSTTSVFYLALLSGLAAGIAIFSIFQYRNRLRQILLGAINSILMVTVLGFFLYYSLKGADTFAPYDRGQYGPGFYAVVGALLCNMLANRFIRRDENLVRSADRMR